MATSQRRRALLVCTLLATTTTLETAAAVSQQPQQRTTTVSLSSSSSSPYSVYPSVLSSADITRTTRDKGTKTSNPIHLHRAVSARRREFWMDWARGGAPNRLARPAVSISRRTVAGGSLRHAHLNSVQQVVSTRTKQLTQQIRAKLPPPPPKDDTAFFYGFTVNMVDASTTDRPPPEKRKPKTPKLKETMVLTLEEIRMMRAEMEELRRELQSIKQHLVPPTATGPGEALALKKEERTKVPIEGAARLSKAELERMYNEISKNVETWAKQMLQEDVEQGGWAQIKCNKAMRKALNPDDSTEVFLKWMKDERGPGYVDPNDDREYPCLKCTGVIDAPLDVVTLYLAKEENLPEYNDLIEQHKDLQEITPSAKVTLGKTPKILFIQPRNLVTFCEHKWLANGSQLLMLNQAVRHPKKLNKNNVGLFDKSDLLDDKKQPMAFALRGANLLTPDPDDPQHKTRLTILAHGNPGRDVPTWAMKTAVGALANLEPYRFFYKINQSILQKLPELHREIQSRETQLVTASPEDDYHTGRIKRPAGIAQLGYACFWPNGGGTVEPSYVGPRPPNMRPIGSTSGRIHDDSNHHEHSKTEATTTTTTESQLSAVGNSL